MVTVQLPGHWKLPSVLGNTVILLRRTRAPCGWCLRSFGDWGPWRGEITAFVGVGPVSVRSLPLLCRWGEGGLEGAYTRVRKWDLLVTLAS